MRKNAEPLEVEIRTIFDLYLTNPESLTVLGGHLTSTSIVNNIRERADRKVSSGAVTAAILRLAEVGAIEVEHKPLRFVDYTDEARQVGVKEMKRRHRAKRKAAKALEGVGEVQVDPHMPS